MGKVAIVENLQRGDNTFFCCNWNPTSSNVTTSSFDRLVLIFTGHVLGTIGQSNTYFFKLPLTQHLMSLGQNQNSYSPLLGERNYTMNHLHVEACVPCFPIPTLALHIVLIMVCIAQHRLAELGGNLPVCHLDARQSISNTDVVWATPWITKLNEFLYALKSCSGVGTMIKIVYFVELMRITINNLRIQDC